MTLRDRSLPALTALTALGSLVALCLPWVNDETGRTPGLLLLSPTTDIGSGGLGWLRATPVLASLAVVLSVVAVPWWRASTVRASRISDRAAWATILCGLSALLAVIMTVTLGPRADIGLPATALLGIAGSAIWSMVAVVTDPGRRVDGDADLGTGHIVVIVAVLVVAALAVSVGTPWWVYGRHIDASTTEGPVTSVDVRGPDEPAELLWTKPADGVLPAGQYVVALGDGDGKSGSGEGVVVVEAATGTDRWHYSRGDGPARSMVVSAEDDLVVVSIELDEDSLYELVALDLSSGAVRWTRRGEFELIDAADGIVLVVDSSAGAGSLAALSTDSGDRVWTHTDRACGDRVRPVGDLILNGPDCTGDGTLLAVDRATREPAWETTVGDDLDDGKIRAHVRVGATVVLGVRGWWQNEAGQTNDGVIAFDSESGEELWRHSLEVDKLAALGDRVIVTTNGGAPFVRSFSARTGKSGWTLDPPRDRDGGPTVVTDGSRGYLVAERGDEIALYGFDREGQMFSTTTVPACADSTCVGNGDGVAVSSTGSLSVGDRVLIVGSTPYALVAGGRVYITAIG